MLGFPIHVLRSVSIQCYVETIYWLGNMKTHMRRAHPDYTTVHEDVIYYEPTADNIDDDVQSAVGEHESALTTSQVLEPVVSDDNQYLLYSERSAIVNNLL